MHCYHDANVIDAVAEWLADGQSSKNTELSTSANCKRPLWRIRRALAHLRAITDARMNNSWNAGLLN